MNHPVTLRARLVRLTQLALALPLLATALLSAPDASAQGGPNQVFLPLLTKGGQATHPTPPPTPAPRGVAGVGATCTSDGEGGTSR